MTFCQERVKERFSRPYILAAKPLVARLLVVSNLLQAGNDFKQKRGREVLQQHGKIWGKMDKKIALHEMENLFSYSSANSNPGEGFSVPPHEIPPMGNPP